MSSLQPLDFDLYFRKNARNVWKIRYWEEDKENYFIATHERKCTWKNDFEETLLWYHIIDQIDVEAKTNKTRIDSKVGGT